MPLTSPSDALSALLSPAVGGAVPPVPASARRCAAARCVGVSAVAPSGAPNSPGGRDRRDALLEELVIRVLERDHDLRVVLVGIHFGLERLGRAERERGRDHAVDLARTKRVVDERVLDRRIAGRCRACSIEVRALAFPATSSTAPPAPPPPPPPPPPPAPPPVVRA